jgi:hypothetical protein
MVVLTSVGPIVCHHGAANGVRPVLAEVADQLSDVFLELALAPFLVRPVTMVRSSGAKGESGGKLECAPASLATA